MARSLLIAVAALSALAATPALAQQSGREAGLRYLSWPGRPAQSAPSRPERQAPPPRPRPRPEPEVETPPSPPVADSPVQARIEQISTPRPADEGPRYYSVHRGAGRTPDPIDQAQVLAAEDTLVALQSPQGQSLAEQDRTSRAEEAFEILRSLPPDQLMDMLDRSQ